MMASQDKTVGVEPWDTEWAAQLAAEALRWLGRNYPECVASGVLREHEEAAHEAAMDADEVRYREALRAYMRAGRDEALRIRRGAA
ncbi:MAG TPA: hypothetical protein VGP38_11515 [Rubrobacter sp.]|nr:hypothetical protein [Rubrobacter sp.]